MYNGKLLVIAVASLAAWAAATADNKVVDDFQNKVNEFVKTAKEAAGKQPVNDPRDDGALLKRTEQMTYGVQTSYARTAIGEVGKAHKAAVKGASDEDKAKLNEIRDRAETDVYWLIYDDDMVQFQKEVNDIVIGACRNPLDAMTPAPTDDMNAADARAPLKDRRRLAIALRQPATRQLQARYDAAVNKVEKRDGAIGKLHNGDYKLTGANGALMAEVTKRQMGDALKVAMSDLDALVPAHPDVTEFQTAADTIFAKAETDVKAAAPSTDGADAAQLKEQRDKARPIVEAAQAELEATYKKAVEACKDADDAANDDLKKAFEGVQQQIGALSPDAGAAESKENAVAAPSTTIAFSSAVAAVLVAAVAA
ncbi:Uncharacterized protein PBTT_09025 [Plasmodiophora brassicae]